MMPRTLACVVVVSVAFCELVGLSSAPAADATAQTPAPVIILKLDDLKFTSASAPIAPRWLQLADYIQKNKLKASIGIICSSLENGNAAYVQWIKDLHERQIIEFWFHGYDHATHKVDGVDYSEFTGRPYDEQKAHFDKALKLAEDKLGFPLHAFGPPGGGTKGTCDANTVQVMADVPAMKVWLYPQPMDDVGRELEAKGKVTILDRVWAVNIENPLFVPSLAKLQAGYEKSAAQRKYFVLQGHPTHWTDEGWDQFTKICDYLTAKGCVFMTPSEYVQSMSKKSAGDRVPPSGK